jgi:hypothetical protein
LHDVRVVEEHVALPEGAHGRFHEAVNVESARSTGNPQAFYSSQLGALFGTMCRTAIR